MRTIRPTRLTGGLALLNTNIVLQIWLIHLILSFLGIFGYFREKRVATDVVHVLTFDWNQVEVATMSNKRATAIHNIVVVVFITTTIIIIIAICVATVV